jgi:hypothetical protein
MTEISTRNVLMPPAILCALMIVGGLTTATIADIDFSQLFLPYFGASAAVTIVCVLLSLFWWTLKLAVLRADDPLRVVSAQLRERLPFLILPVVVFPLFLIAFTTSKTAIPFIVGYRWDAFWANADRLLFGDDAFRIAHRWFGTGSMLMWQWFYTVAWGLTLVFVKALVALNARRSRVAIFYTAMMATWLIGGFVFAYAMSAAGPAFAHLVDPQLSTRFLSLSSMLDHSLPADAPIRATQQYLSRSLDLHVAVNGGGVSAMPSMHLGAASIYVLAARGTRWLVPAVLFWAIIFVCSGYFGYHYWIDGIVAAVIAIVCWASAERYFAGSRRTYAPLVAQPA